MHARQVLRKPRPGAHGTIGGMRHADSVQHSPRLPAPDGAMAGSLRNLSSTSLSSLGGGGAASSSIRALSPPGQLHPGGGGGTLRGLGSMHSRSGSVLDASSLANAPLGMSPSDSAPGSRNASHSDLASLAGHHGGGGSGRPPARAGSFAASRGGSHVDLSSLGRGGTGGIWDASPAEMESFRRRASHNVST